jgi:D-tyrosyl-tRNA(Tyr) deacylase
MVALVQRVSEASVAVDGREVASVGRGLLVLLGVHRTDTAAEASWLARKVANLRIFPDAEGLLNLSGADTGAEALVVSQFTLYGNTDKGNRPSFVDSAEPALAEPLYRAFARDLGEHLGRTVPTGEFGAVMQVALVNDGPVTLWVERRAS